MKGWSAGSACRDPRFAPQHHTVPRCQPMGETPTCKADWTILSGFWISRAREAAQWGVISSTRRCAVSSLELIVWWWFLGYLCPL